MLVYSSTFQILIVVFYFCKQTSPSHNESFSTNTSHSNINLFESCGTEPNDIFYCIAGIIYFMFLVTLITGIIFCIFLFYKSLLLVVALDEQRTLRLHRLDVEEFNDE